MVTQKTFFVGCISVIAVLLFCTVIVLHMEQSKPPSSFAEEVIKVVANCPNEDFMTKILSAGVHGTEKALFQKEKERILQNWEIALGEYFSENCLHSTMVSGNLLEFHYWSVDFNEKVSVLDMRVLKRLDQYESVLCSVQAGQEIMEVLFDFHYNPDGKISGVDIGRYIDGKGDFGRRIFPQT